MAAFYIDLDTVEFGDQEFQNFLTYEGITARCIQPDTEGDWPVYRYEGPLLALVRLCTGPYDDQDLVKFIKVKEVS